MRKLLINNTKGKQEIITVSDSGGYFDHKAILWDENKDGKLPSITLGGMERVNGKLVFNSAVMDANNAIFLAESGAEKMVEINTACAGAIVGGFSSSALGTAHTYDSAMEDQLNLIGAAGANVDLQYSCTDAAGIKDALLHSAAQLKQVYADGVIHKTTQLSKARALKVQLDILAANPASTQADIDAVIW